MTKGDDALDRLFAAPPKAFVATRDAIAKERKAAGDAEGAAAIAKEKRPTPTAWAIDWVAREHGDAMRAYVAAADRVRVAQRDVIRGGDRAALDDARDAMTKLESRLMQLAREGMKAAGTKWTPEAQRRIAQTLHAVPFASDEERELVTRGRLVKDLEPGDPFEAMAAFVGPRTQTRTQTQTQTRTPTPTRLHEERERAREAKAAKEREAKAAKERERRRAHAKALEEKARAIEAKARRARMEASKLEDEARAARRAADEARAEAEG